MEFVVIDLDIFVNFFALSQNCQSFGLGVVEGFIYFCLQMVYQVAFDFIFKFIFHYPLDGIVSNFVYAFFEVSVEKTHIDDLDIIFVLSSWDVVVVYGSFWEFEILE